MCAIIDSNRSISNAFDVETDQKKTVLHTIETVSNVYGIHFGQHSRFEIITFSFVRRNDFAIGVENFYYRKH